jgi:tetratricopeptide (TPR) repeat protein
MIDHRDVLSRCFELAGAGKLTEAGDLAEEALRENDDDGYIWQFVGLIRHRVGDFNGARDALETAGLLVPLNPETRCALAESFARTGVKVPAVELYRALASDPRCPERLLPSIAAGLGCLGQYDDALGVCLDLTRRAPDQADAYFGVAFYQRRLGHGLEVAIPWVMKAHELSPDVPLYRISLAAMLDHVGRHEEAYDLLLDVDLDGISCRCCLRRMSTIFLSVGDVGRGLACEAKSKH